MANNNLAVRKINEKEDLDKAFEIRRIVYVEEQNISPEEEFDLFDKDSIHFLAEYDKTACGTARWRKTENGIKLERFAVLERYRGRGVASLLIKSVLKDIADTSPDTLLYLHAQTDVVPLYQKFDFKIKGEVFFECDIPHQKMVKFL